MDCASAPALYESSAEYYSSEQKKTHKITQTLSKNPDLQQINSDATNIREKAPKRTTVKETPIPSTTERFLRHRQRLQGENQVKQGRNFQGFPEVFPTQRSQLPPVPTGFEKRRNNLVQLIGNNFGGIGTRTTLPAYTDAATYRTTAPAGDFNGLREMQVAAESASFASNNNRQYLTDYQKNLRQYPVYTPTARPNKAKASPTLTTLFVHDIRSNKQTTPTQDVTTKRPTLLPYTKSYVNSVSGKHEPYTRPGVSLLKDFLEREKNKTYTTTTEKISQATDRADVFGRSAFETATKIPQTTRSDTYYSDTASSDRFDVYSTNNYNHFTTPATYQERRERLMRKLNMETFAPTEATLPTTGSDKFGRRPGLVVPPSLTPKTLHTLAIYYATALDNLSTTEPPQEGSETTTTAIDDYEGLDDGLPALFSRHTLNKYSKLFMQGMSHSDLLEEIKLDPNGTYNELTDDLTVQQSQNPISSSPQIRELAQVFTHALSAYLQDPVQFRKVLSDIRPTQPSFADIGTTTDEGAFNTEPTTTVNEDDEEILGFSDENKTRPALAQLRDGKALNPSTVYPVYSETETSVPKEQTTEAATTTESPTSTTSIRSIFRCCGRISASYTTASTSGPRESSTTPTPFTDTFASNYNVNNESDTYVTTTEDNYAVPRYGGFQNNTQAPNDSPYGAEASPTGAKPLSEYVEVTNLPTAWGVDISDTTGVPITNADLNEFESKKIKPTTYSPITTTPVYFTETDSVELENEEELQRAHSQSFLAPENSVRQGKNINFESDKNSIRRPSEDLEAPTITFDAETTTALPITTYKPDETDIPTTITPEFSSIFTSPDGDKSTNQYQWSNTFENWQSTVVLDPITLNDGLTDTGPQQGLSQLASQTTSWAANTGQNIATTPQTFQHTATNEQDSSPSQVISQTTPANYIQEENRSAKIKQTTTESTQDLTTIAETVVEKAKEIMGEMNATTTEKLMNVMKKTKSKTVRRLILLLVQTCDDDHNSTAEASKRALLEALMQVSQKDMDQIAKEQEEADTQTTASDYDPSRYTNAHRRSEKVVETQEVKTPKRGRSGKALNFDPSAINSLSNPGTTEVVKAETIVETTVSNTTPMPFTKTTPSIRRGTRKFLVRTTPADSKYTKGSLDSPKAEARVAPSGELKPASDTRAIELLRSLYTIAARWG